MRTEDLDNVSENDYIFEIDCLQTMSGLGGREVFLKHFECNFVFTFIFS